MFKTLYVLQGQNDLFLEVKRGDSPSETDPSKLFYWLHYDGAIKMLKKLDFVDMESYRGQEKRVFEQGELMFNTQLGSYTPKGERDTIILERKPTQLSDVMKARVEQYLKLA